MPDYSTRRGTRRARKAVESYADLLDQPTRHARDDGRTILHVGDLEPTCADCGRGKLRWAEGGFVAWHRICDVCGSHWDLHPLGMGVAFVPAREAATCGFPTSRAVCRSADAEACAMRSGAPGGACACVCHVPPSERRIVEERPSIWVDGTGWVALDPQSEIGAGRTDSYTGEGLGPPGRTWGELLALIAPGHVEAAERDRDRTLDVPCVPACWARRARFY